MKSIAVDVDGVLAAFNPAFHSLLVAQGADMLPLDGEPHVWNWPEAYGASAKEINAAWRYVDEKTE